LTLHDTAHTYINHTKTDIGTLSSISGLSEQEIDDIMSSEEYDNVAQCVEEVLDLSEYEFTIVHDFDRHETIVMKILEKGGGR